MKLRLCTIDFKKSARVQEGESIKTRKKGDSYTIVELGIVESFGKPHLCGVISQDVTNVMKVKKEIEDLENMTVEKRIEWFASYFPKARVVKIESSLVFDLLKDTKSGEDPTVVISSAADLKWSK